MDPKAPVKKANGKKSKPGWNDATARLHRTLAKLEQDTEEGLSDLKRRVQAVRDEAIQVSSVAQATKRSR